MKEMNMSRVRYKQCMILADTITACYQPTLMGQIEWKGITLISSFAYITPKITQQFFFSDFSY